MRDLRCISLTGEFALQQVRAESPVQVRPQIIKIFFYLFTRPGVILRLCITRALVVPFNTARNLHIDRTSSWFRCRDH